MRKLIPFHSFKLLCALALVVVACSSGDVDDNAAAGGDEIGEDGASEETELGDESDEARADDDLRGPFRLGLLLPDVGPFAGLAEDQHDGIELYIDTLNGGMLAGYDVEIITADTANEPSVAMENVQRLVERDQVDIVVGVISSAIAYAIAPYIEESGIPLIYTAAAADDLTQRDSTANVFRVTPTASQYMMPLATYACVELGYETAAMVSLDYSFGWEAMGGFAQAYQDAGCEVVQELYSPLGTADWAPIVQQIDQEVDVIVQTTTGADAARFLQAYRDFGLSEIPMLGHGAGTDPSSLPNPQDKALAEGVRSSLHYAESSDISANQEFIAAFSEEHGSIPGLYAEATYTAAMVIEAALTDLDEVTDASLAEAISGVILDSAPRGDLEFDEYGQAIVTLYLRDMVEIEGEWMNEEIAIIGDSITQFWNYDPTKYMDQPTYIDRVGTWVNQ